MRSKLLVETLFTAAEAEKMEQMVWFFRIKVVLTNEWDGRREQNLSTLTTVSRGTL